MKYIWIYEINKSTIKGIVSADNETEAEEKVYDKYSNYGIKIDNIILIKAEYYNGYDVDHNVLEF